MGEMPIFAGFWAIGPLKPAFGAGLTNQKAGCPILRAPLARRVETHSILSYLSPNSTFLLGARLAAIGVFSASTTGAATLK